MSIITTILTALIAINNASVTIDDLCFDKRDYQTAMMSAVYDQNRYCLNFIKELEQKDEIQDFTNITVLTHGLGSSYEDWLPIVYDYDSGCAVEEYLCTDYSLPFVLSGLSSHVGTFTENINTSIYMFEPVNQYFYNYISDPKDTHIKQLRCINGVFSFYDVTDININDINEKNIVLIYNGTPEEYYYTVDQCVSRFEACLSNVLCRIYNAQFATLGRVNLVGHSKGGLVNLLFSTRHPKLVNNLISLGTPYEGSSWASVLHAIEEMEYVANPTEKNWQDVEVYNDLLDPAHPFAYSSLFNSICNDINSFALGFNMTPSALIYSIISAGKPNTESPEDFNIPMSINSIMQFPAFLKTYIEKQYGNGPVLDFCNSLLYEFLNAAIQYTGQEIETLSGAVINTLIDLAFPLLVMLEDDFSKAKSLSDFSKMIADFFGGNETINNINLVITSLLRFVNSLLNVFRDASVIFTGNIGIINSDICVNTSSQLGANYFNFDEVDVVTISPLGTNSIYDFYHCARPSLTAVPHNFEVKNPISISKIHNFIISNDGLCPFSIQNANMFKMIKMAVFVNDEDWSFIKIGELIPSMFNYPDYYVYEYEIKNDALRWRRNIISGDFNITTDVLRTGFIQSEKIVLSPDRSYAGAAFIEFTLDKPAWKISFDISMWSAKENQTLTDEVLFIIDNPYTMDAIKKQTLYQSKTCETISSYIAENLYYRRDNSALHPEIYKNIVTNSEYEALCGLKNARSISLSSISQDRNSPDNIELIFEKPTKQFGFYAVVKNISERKNNKGRICLGDMTIYG